MEKRKVPLSDLDYVELYSEKLREDSSLFQQQKRFIECQLKASHSLFSNMFGDGEKFKANARKYLKEMGLI